MPLRIALESGHAKVKPRANKGRHHRRFYSGWSTRITPEREQQHRAHAAGIVLFPRNAPPLTLNFFCQRQEGTLEKVRWAVDIGVSFPWGVGAVFWGPVDRRLVDELCDAPKEGEIALCKLQIVSYNLYLQFCIL